VGFAPVIRYKPVIENTLANEIIVNLDPELFTTTRPESSFVEFAANPDSSLAEALRRNGCDVNGSVETLSR